MSATAADHCEIKTGTVLNLLSAELVPNADGFNLRSSGSMISITLGSKLGKGKYAVVFQATSTDVPYAEQPFAIKVSRNSSPYFHSLRSEYNRVEYIHRDSDKIHESRSTGVQYIVRFYGYYECRVDSFQSECIIMPLHGPDLYKSILQPPTDVLDIRNRKCSLEVVGIIGAQLIAAVSYLECRRIVHSDIKPENIIRFLCQETLRPSLNGLICFKLDTSDGIDRDTLNQLKIVLGDFGIAEYCTGTPGEQKILRCSPYYASPECEGILGMPVDKGYPHDMWSIACVLFELYTGHPLFPAKADQNFLHLDMFWQIIGPPADEFLDSLKKNHEPIFNKYFEERATGETPRYLLKQQSGIKFNSLEQHVKGSHSKCCKPSPATSEEELFINLLHAILKYNVDERITPSMALTHPFLSKYAELIGIIKLTAADAEHVATTTEVGYVRRPVRIMQELSKREDLHSRIPFEVPDRKRPLAEMYRAYSQLYSDSSSHASSSTSVRRSIDP